MSKADIKIAIQNFSQGSLTENALNLFKTLGYNTERQAPLDRPDYAAFKENYINPSSRFDEKKALVNDWKHIDLLFQLSKEEVLKQTTLFDTRRVDNAVIESYLFFAVELSKPHYSRTELSHITREVNRLFPMPVMLLFKHGETMTLSVINRRLHKRDEGRDVLEKVTLIKDIRIDNPHRAHIEILFDLASDELLRKHRYTNFIELHNAWQKTLDTKELNKRFFQELANWYFWAVQNVEFPDDAEKKRDVRNATNVIRLITRLMFVWFLKEKGLVSEELFDEKRLKEILVQNSSIYYKAILQNLFFATLNTEMGKRRFRSKNDSGRDSHYFIHNVFRYEKEFVDPKETLERYFASIPFLNGGLFECLDKEVEEGGKLKRIRIDGFSDRDDNSLKVPDELFFGAEKETDLNDTYGTKNKHYKVRGLIDILSSYKFTIAENTPIEEEVALDPELLGKVFENLLANFNPETQTTARKQTGSFYTPREIVNYMVDESLIAYLSTVFASNETASGHALTSSPRPITLSLSKGGEGNNETRLRHLLSYSEEPHRFTEEEVIKLISAIDYCKILDPAGGSGAFPMGMLHKLVHILSKLDPDNARWEQRQLDKVDKLIEDAEGIPDAGVREKVIEDLQRNRQDIEDSFANNELDYGRKLYLIENCIYGIDIQPIAVQIAKLRFFISLIVEQKTNPEKENLGIRPLPNLETKFVAANTLIGINRPAQLMLRNPQIDKVEEELRQVREKHFAARTPATKEKYRKKDAELRQALTQLLEKDGWPVAEARKIASWDPYDQNTSSPWFDPEWMFGIKDGFDITIGNPPYVSHDKIKEKKEIKDQYLSYEPFADIYCYFIECAINLQNKQGLLCYITSNSYLRSDYGKPIRKLLKEKNDLLEIINIEDSQVFESAIVNVAILIAARHTSNRKSNCHVVNSPFQGDESFEKFAQREGFDYPQNVFTDKPWSLLKPKLFLIQKKIESNNKTLEQLGTKIRLGLATGHNEAFVIDETKKKELCELQASNAKIIRPILRGRDISRFNYKLPGLYILLAKNGVDVRKDYPFIYNHLESFGESFKKRGAQGQHWANLRACSFFDDFKKEKIIWIELADVGRFALCKEEVYLLNSAYFLLPPSGVNSLFLLGILNSSVIRFYLGLIAETSGMGTSRWINNFVKEFPIPDVPMDKQQPIVKLVDQILAAKQKDPKADTSALEKQIDEMVYTLYGLTEEEIAVVAGRP